MASMIPSAAKAKKSLLLNHLANIGKDVLLNWIGGENYEKFYALLDSLQLDVELDRKIRYQYELELNRKMFDLE